MSGTARFVGRSGEKRFGALCSDEGVTCNPAHEDDHGWDHVIQFPHRAQPFVPADLQRSLPAIFVQTKTQSSESGSVRMKLSNALALARSPNPCFVVAAPSKGSPEARWRSFHFWDQAIGQTLKRARKETSQGVREELSHKKSITFKFADADWHNEEDLLPWIERTVREAAFDYAQAKTSLLDSVGFGPDRFVGTIQFGPMRSIEELIDHQIGLTETIPIDNFQLRDRRFGVEVNVPIPTGPGMIGTLHSHPKPCLLRLRGPDDTKIELQSDLIVGSLPGLPVEQCKFRVRSDFVDFVMSPAGTSKFTLKYNTASRFSPEELEKRVRLLSWAGHGSIDVQVWIDDKKLFGGTADIGARRDQQAYERLTLLAGPLVSLSAHLRVSVPEISIEDASAAEDSLVSLYGFVTSPDMNVSAEVSSDRLPSEIDQVLTYGFADVGSWRFGALIQWQINEHSIDDSRWILKLVSPRIAERYAYEATDEAAFCAFDADFGRLSAVPGTLVMDDNAVARLTASQAGLR